MSIQSGCKGRRREKKRDYFESRTGSEKKEMVLGVEPILSREQACRYALHKHLPVFKDQDGSIGMASWILPVALGMQHCGCSNVMW